jgi:endonuclease G
VVFVRDASFGPLPEPWSHLGEVPGHRERIEAAIPSVGRVDLPSNLRFPYGGTGFVVGPDLLMTNRHVAEIFSSGLGLGGLIFRAGETAAVDFRRERDTPPEERSAYVTVRGLVMIHPFWDMAILRVSGLPAGARPLKLSIRAPEGLVGADVAVIGYPARDERNDLELQDRIFERAYNVKRLQPGKIRRRERIRSFSNPVDAMTHDSSTLGGNSGSAVLDVATGEIVGLHFAGVYLRANYAVPTYELARDSRVVDAGLNFTGTLAPTSAWRSAWDRADPVEASPNTAGARVAVPAGDAASATTWTIPLQISVSIGTPVAEADAPQTAKLVAADAEERPMQVPVMHGDLESRLGYRPDFLELDDESHIPMPALTPAGKRVAAELDDGSRPPVLDRDAQGPPHGPVHRQQRRLAPGIENGERPAADPQGADGHSGRRCRGMGHVPPAPPEP